jgi:DNA-binding transcriptional LysR family regulator
MDPRKLLYLASVIEHGSFKKAAKHLLISQPALSTSMDRLEKSLGGKLFKRGPAGISPTSLGELLYTHARLIRDEMDLAEHRMRQLDNDNDGVLTFGVVPTLATSVIPTAILRWRETYPMHRVRVVHKVHIELLTGLIRGDLDFIVGRTDTYDFLDGIKRRVLFRDRLYVMGHPNHPVFNLGPPTWAELARFPWILPIVGNHRTLLESILTSEGVALPMQLTECDSIDFIKSIVAESDHLALLPTHTVTDEIKSGKIRALELSVQQLNRDIAVIFREREPLDEASRSLVAHIEAVGSSFGRGQVLLSPVNSGNPTRNVVRPLVRGS